MTDDECLQKIRLGGRERDAGISGLYRSYAKRIIAYFVHRHRVPQGVAEEIAQNAFVSVVRHCDSFRGETRIDAWIWAIARNALMDHFRRQRPEDPADDDDLEMDHFRRQRPEDPADDDDLERIEDPDENPENYVQHRALDDCVKQGYAVFARTYGDRAHWLSMISFEGWSIGDVATALSRTNGATREYLSQSRKKLKPYLEPCQKYLRA